MHLIKEKSIVNKSLYIVKWNNQFDWLYSVERNRKNPVVKIKKSALEN